LYGTPYILSRGNVALTEQLGVELGERLRRAREVADLTQAELGKAVGVARGAVIAWEQGAAAIALPNLRALSVTLGVSADWLIHGPGDVTVALQKPLSATPTKPKARSAAVEGIAEVTRRRKKPAEDQEGTG
jgi:transcriptional regulator with XRE-family HTH domain